MRVYGRIQNPYPLNGEESSSQLPNGYKWVVVETDENGYDDYCYITALIQCFRLNLAESPFWAQFGIPAKTAVMMQLQPDYYVAFIQSYFAKYFASLIISKRAQTLGDTTPRYDVSIVRLNGSKYQTTVAI